MQTLKVFRAHFLGHRRRVGLKQSTKNIFTGQNNWCRSKSLTYFEWYISFSFLGTLKLAYSLLIQQQHTYDLMMMSNVVAMWPQLIFYIYIACVAWCLVQLYFALFYHFGCLGWWSLCVHYTLQEIERSLFWHSWTLLGWLSGSVTSAALHLVLIASELITPVCVKQCCQTSPAQPCFHSILCTPAGQMEAS